VHASHRANSRDPRRRSQGRSRRGRRRAPHTVRGDGVARSEKRRVVHEGRPRGHRPPQEAPVVRASYPWDRGTGRPGRGRIGTGPRGHALHLSSREHPRIETGSYCKEGSLPQVRSSKCQGPVGAARRGPVWHRDAAGRQRHPRQLPLLPVFRRRKEVVRLLHPGNLSTKDRRPVGFRSRHLADAPTVVSGDMEGGLRRQGIVGVKHHPRHRRGPGKSEGLRRNSAGGGHRGHRGGGELGGHGTRDGDGEERT